MRPKIYLLPGMAADRRLYQNYTFEGYTVEVLEWIEPLKNEPFDAYARRYSEPINTAEPFVLIGTSLGGVVAGHISQYLNPELVVLISSILHVGELPKRLRAFRYFPLHKITPFFLVKHSIQMMRMINGGAEREQLKLLHQMVDCVSPHFFRWAAHQMVSYQRKEFRAKHYLQIHGTLDSIFPIRYITGITHEIDGGNHFMVIDKSKRINQIILDELDKLEIK